MSATITKVALRRRPISGARESLYLDFYPAIRDPYSMGMKRREYLGIYIYAKPRTEMEKGFNHDMLMKAEVIRSLRVQSIINEEFGFLDKHKKNLDFLAYFESKAKTKDQKWEKVYLHFRNFVKRKCLFGEVTVELCNKFREYLLNTKQLKHKDLYISQNSASGYFSTFRALLKIAHKEKLLRENLNEYLDSIETTDVKKEYLTLNEVKQLAKTPCDLPILKSAALFSCMTGLRISDILKLDWKEIISASDGGYCMRIRTDKTETETTLPISDEALELCGKQSKGKVFKGLERSMTQQPLKNWIREAGIFKNVTFHCLRHSNSSLRLKESELQEAFS
jgi:integrase